MAIMDRVPYAAQLLHNVTATGTGTAMQVPYAGGKALFQAYLYGTSGALTGTIELYGSNDPLSLLDPAKASSELLATFSLSGTGDGEFGTRADGAIWIVEAPYLFFWGKVTGISGTGATVNLTGAY